MITSEAVNLEEGVYQRFRAVQKEWEVHDRYSNPGPIQLFGEGKDIVNKTILLRQSNFSKMTKDVRDLCELIQRDCTFIEDPQLLVATIASL